MKLLHGILTALAALIVIAFGSERAFQHYQSWQYSRQIEGVDSEDDEESSAPKVPTTGTALISVFHASLGEEILDFDAETDAAVIPVFLKEQAPYETKKLELSANDVGAGTDYLNTCDDSPMVNVAYVRPASGEARLVFDGRVYLPSVGALRSAVGDIIIIFAVERDANGDNFLTCDDEAQLLIYRAETETLIRTSIFFNADSSAIREVDGKTIMAALNSPGSDDHEDILIYAINLETGAAQQVETPDLTSAAQIAFENIKE